MISKIDLVAGLSDTGAGLDTVFGGTSIGGLSIQKSGGFDMSKLTPAFLAKCLLLFVAPLALKVYEDITIKKAEANVVAAQVELDKLKVKKDEQKKILAEIDGENKQINFQSRIDEFNAKKKLAKDISKKKTSAVSFLDYVSEVTPLGVWLNSLGYKGDSRPLDIKGKATKYNEVVKFVNNLKKHPRVSSANLRSVKAETHDKRAYHSFHIVLNFKRI